MLKGVKSPAQVRRWVEELRWLIAFCYSRFIIWSSSSTSAVNLLRIVPSQIKLMISIIIDYAMKIVERMNEL